MKALFIFFPLFVLSSTYGQIKTPEETLKQNDPFQLPQRKIESDYKSHPVDSTDEVFPDDFNKYPIVFVIANFSDSKEDFSDKKHMKLNNRRIENFVKRQNKKGKHEFLVVTESEYSEMNKGKYKYTINQVIFHEYRRTQSTAGSTGHGPEFLSAHIGYQINEGDSFKYRHQVFLSTN